MIAVLFVVIGLIVVAEVVGSWMVVVRTRRPAGARGAKTVAG